MTITLPVTKRDDTKSANELRAKGGVPAVVYGAKQPATAIVVDAKVFDKVLKEAGESTIIELSGLAEPVEVLIKEVDFNPVKNALMHVDFLAIEKDKEMTTHVHLEFIGVAPVEESGEGSVTKVLHELEITCKPKDLPAHIDVDLSGLTEVTSKILIKDLNLPKGVTVEAEVDEPVAVVSESRKHAAEESEATTVDMSQIEVEKKGKTEEEAE